MTFPSSLRLTTEDRFLASQSLQDGRLALVESAAGFDAPPLGFEDSIVAALVENDASVMWQKLSGKLAVKTGIPVNLLDPKHGVPTDGVTNATAKINAVLDAAVAANKSVFWPGGRFVYDGYRCAVQAARFSIQGEYGNAPVLLVTQAAVDAGNYVFMVTTSRYSTVPGLALAANIKPNQQKISLTSVAGLSAGMIIQISSNRLWYNGHRGAYYCGEIHKITDVDTAAKTVTLEDFTRDVYSSADVLTIRAWAPNRVSIKNLQIEAPYPATVVTSVGLCLQQCIDSEVENVILKGFRNSMITDNLNWNTQFNNVRFSQDDKLDTSVGNGYGIETNGSVGTRVDGLRSKGLRRAYDAGSISGTTEAAVARDILVQNYDITGGGAWFPNTAATSYGIGGHGSYENLYIGKGYIRDISNAITARGRNTIVDGPVFQGTIDSCVSLHENGAGLILRNPVTDGFNYPNKFASLADIVPGSGIRTLVQLGLTSGGVDANNFYDLPIIVDGAVAKGLTGSLIHFGQNTLVAKNLRVTNNHAEAIPGAGNTFTTFAASAAGTNLTGSVFDNNTVEEINGTVVQWSPNLVPAYREAATLKFKVDGAHWARIPTDTVVRIPRVAKAGQRIIVMFHADAGGGGIFRMTPENAALTPMGAALQTSLKGTATGASLTGTTGLTGELTFGLMLNGDLYIENRLPGAYTFRLTIQ